MTRAELLAEFREVTRDDVAPYHWSDIRAMRLLSDGQDRFCEDTGFFIDATNYTITTQAGVKSYNLDPRIIEVRDVYDGVRRLNRFHETQRPLDFSLTTNQSPVNWQSDRETGVLTLFEPPTAGIVLTLRVWRRTRSPLNRKTSTVTLGGVLHTGDVVSATVNGNTFSYTTLAGDVSLSAVATALAALIDASTAFVASAAGQVITVTSSNLAVSTTITTSVSGAGATTTAVATDNYTAEPEIPTSFHSACVEWAAHKALSDHDAEKQDPVKAADHLTNYKVYTHEGKKAFDRINGASPRIVPSAQYVV